MFVYRFVPTGLCRNASFFSTEKPSLKGLNVNLKSRRDDFSVEKVKKSLLSPFRDESKILLHKQAEILF